MPLLWCRLNAELNMTLCHTNASALKSLFFINRPTTLTGLHLNRQFSTCRCQTDQKAETDNAFDRWKCYVKLRKYAAMYTSTRAFSSITYHAKIASVNAFMPVQKAAYSKDVGQPRGPSRRKLNAQVQESTEVQPKLKDDFLGLPGDVEADLRSLSHFSEKEKTRHSLDPQEFPVVTKQIIEEYLKARDVPYEGGFTSFYMKCPRFVKSRAVKNLKESLRLYVNNTSGTAKFSRSIILAFCFVQLFT